MLPNLKGIFGDMGIGAIVGFITGYIFKKVLKIALLVLGIYTTSLIYLQQKGVISINKDALFNLGQNLVSHTSSLVDKFLGLAPGGVAFAGAFYVGFHKG